MKSQPEEGVRACALTVTELEFGFVSAVDATSGIGRVHFKRRARRALYVDQERRGVQRVGAAHAHAQAKPYKLS